MSCLQSAEFSAEETHGFVRLANMHVDRTSTGLGWSSAFVTTQAEDPYVSSFQPNPSILISLIDGGIIRGSVSTRCRTEILHYRPGCMSIFPDGMAFDVALESAVQSTHIYLRRTVVDEVAARIYKGDPSNLTIIPQITIVDPIIQHLCLALRSALDGDVNSSGLYVDQMAGALAAHLLRTQSDADKHHRQMPSKGKLSPRQLGRAREIIEERLSKHLTIAQIAADSGMSTDHFGHLFKQAMGMTLYHYVLECRVDRARHLLSQTIIPITAVAHECGFSDQVHLTRAFRRLTGTTPAAFRRGKTDNSPLNTL